MSVDLFIPEVWAAQLQQNLRKQLIFGQAGVCNRDYEGEIAAYGDTVHIGHLTDVTIGDYVKNTTVISPQTLATTDQTLLIDQSKFFAFEVDDVDARQVRDSGNLMSSAAQSSAYGLADTADRFLAATMAEGAGSIPAKVTIAASNDLYATIRQMMVTLDKNNVPTDGRFLAVSPDAYAVLLADNRFINAMAYGSTSPIQNGIVGGILGFTVVKSNNLSAALSTTVEAPAWVASTKYNKGDQVSLSGGAILTATVGGTSGSTAPTAPTAVGGTVTDGTVTWALYEAASDSTLIAGHPMGLTFAEQINKVEAFRPQDSFSDAIKGLHLYGAKVVRPEALVAQDASITVSSSN